MSSFADTLPDPPELSEAAAATVDAEQLRLRHETRETHQRMRLGGLFYVVGWIFIVVDGGPTGQLAWSVGAVLLALALVRLAYPAPPDGDAICLRRWLTGPWTLILASCATWGAATGWVLAHPEFLESRTVLLFGGVAFATASAHSFCMRRSFAALTVLLLLLPALWVIFRQPESHNIAWALLVYTGYVTLVMLRSNREWKHQIDLEIELRRQRNLYALRSRRDGLTGLANRMHFDQVLRKAVERGTAGPIPVTLMLLDLDHFKSINDRHGHAQGDACLIAFAERLRTAFDVPGTLVARVGGEEFAILGWSLEFTDACAQAGRFRAQLEAIPLATPKMQLPVSVSVGVAAHVGAGQPPEVDPLRITANHARVTEAMERLYRAADLALYRAKSEGRGRVCVDESHPFAVSQET